MLSAEQWACGLKGPFEAGRPQVLLVCWGDDVGAGGRGKVWSRVLRGLEPCQVSGRPEGGSRASMCHGRRAVRGCGWSGDSALGAHGPLPTLCPQGRGLEEVGFLPVLKWELVGRRAGGGSGTGGPGLPRSCRKACGAVRALEKGGRGWSPRAGGLWILTWGSQSDR